MSVSNGFITAPVSISDVQTAIHNSSTDLGTLCSYHSESGGVQTGINKWAKYKPVVYANKVDQMSDSEFASVNYGLTAPNQKVNVPSTMSDTWTYTPPGGTINAPYRLTDFYHYSHNAKNPIRENGNYAPSLFFTETLDFYFLQSGTVDAYAIQPSDLVALSNFYPAVYITFTYSGTNYAQLITGSSKFGSSSGAGYVSIPYTEFSTPNYNVVRNYYLVASSVDYPSLTDTFTSGYFKCLPYKADINELKGTITFDTAWRLAMSITHVSNFLTWTTGSSGSIASMLSASNYTGTVPSGGGEQYYFGVTPNYCLQIKCTVTNNYSFSVTLNKSSMSYKLARTFVSTSGSGTMYVKAFYNSSGNSINSVTIAAGASATIVIALQDYALRMDSTNTVKTVTTTGQMLAEDIQFYYKGNYARQLSIRLRN